ncbi:MAG: hypothetical protein WC707_06955 [Candidatus Babeliaceae bacterium]|jgi:hypothetical protein
MSITPARFNSITGFIIDNFEGGYFHQNMIRSGEIKDPHNYYATSGETFLGIDRKNFYSPSPSFAKFWQMIDNAGASTNWRYNYKGGSLYAPLKKLVGEFMQPIYENWMLKKLTPKARQIIESDDRLVFTFIYLVWNGSGWFNKFAAIMNDKVAKGVTNPDALVKAASDYRISTGNAIMIKANKEIMAVIDQLKKKADPESGQAY